MYSTKHQRVLCEVQKFFVFIAHLHSVNCHVLENKGLQFYPWWIAITFCGLPRGHYSSHVSRLRCSSFHLWNQTFAYISLYITTEQTKVPFISQACFQISGFLSHGTNWIRPSFYDKETHTALSICIQDICKEAHPKELWPRDNILPFNTYSIGP